MIFADATPEPAMMGAWFYALTAFLAVVGAILAIGSYFATRREVDRLDERVTKIEDNIVAMELRLQGGGEKRAVLIHKRINRVDRAVSRIAGKLGVYEEPADDEGNEE